jgi:hypothetical protein
VYTKGERILLMTLGGRYFGYLQLNNADHIRTLEKTGSTPSAPDTIEVMATCKDFTRKIFGVDEDWDDEATIERSNPGLSYHDPTEDGRFQLNVPGDCYFVLWKGWVDGVAYRRACGAVAAELWEQERENELVDLILG